MDYYSQFIAKSRYSRFLPTVNRREHWEETVNRYMVFMYNHLKQAKDYTMPDDLYKQIKDCIVNLEVMPSMRAIMTAGKALERDNTAGYNCSYLPIDDPKAFDEAMYILLCGTGVGFSVEQKYVNQLPEVPDQLFDSETVISVADSKEGWAKALRQLIALLYSGEVARYDLSKIRPAGARLKTFGGRASGPGPLDELFRFTITKFRGAVGRKLTSIECHDLLCKIGEVVVVGGVRRSAMISLSDLGQFLQEWTSLYNSHSGERGIFSRAASKSQATKNGRRDSNYEFGTNPCSEIILRPYQFCNLTEVVVRAEDTVESLARKVRIATILGTFQSTLTHFPYLRKIWQKNTEEERLLGVSLTGILDNKWMGEVSDSTAKALEQLRKVSVDTNAEFAAILKVPQSAAITCVKPSGTVSQLVNSASGIHTRHSPYYIRRVRGDKKDPLTKFLTEAGIPTEDCVMRPDSTAVFSFPVKAPENARTRDHLTALQHLDLWLMYQRHWCEHKPSVTISVKEDEWMDVGAWVWRNFDEISGISFLPWDGGTYRQAPYEECTKEQYEELLAKMPTSIAWDDLKEEDDNVEGAQTRNNAWL